MTRLADEVNEARYGKYRGFVVSNRDPKKLGRLRLRIPSILGDQASAWALPCFPYGGGPDFGFFAVPEEGAQCWVEFEEGDINWPIWTGTFWQQEQDVPDGASQANPTTKLIQTKSGHVLQFDDKDGARRFRLHHPAGAEVAIAESGSISLVDAKQNAIRTDAEGHQIVVEDCNGNSFTMTESGTVLTDKWGNHIETSATGVSVEAPSVLIKAAKVSLGDVGGESLIKGTSFLTLYAAHTHTVAPLVGGPTSPPIPQGEPSTLSRTTATS